MKTDSIVRYVEQKNGWLRMFGQEWSLMNAQDRQRIAQSLDSDLSPENITCDGELSAAEVKKRYKFLKTAALELKALDPSVTIYEF